MKLNLTNEQKTALIDYLTNDPDCEQLAANEFVADLYDVETPSTFDIVIDEKKGVEIIAAAELLYSEEEEGWYMGDHIDSEATVLSLFKEAGVLE